jgi:hypothetical protein
MTFEEKEEGEGIKSAENVSSPPPPVGISTFCKFSPIPAARGGGGGKTATSILGEPKDTEFHFLN